MIGVDYFETYQPTVLWSEVRTMITQETNLGLVTIQVDYKNAFVEV